MRVSLALPQPFQQAFLIEVVIDGPKLTAAGMCLFADYYAKVL
jgi:hypothetical protein